jgi:hypothetical protein
MSLLTSNQALWMVTSIPHTPETVAELQDRGDYVIPHDVFPSYNHSGLTGKSHEWGIFSRGLSQSQAKTILLQGDAGMGKSVLLQKVLSALTLQPSYPGHVCSPYQGIYINLAGAPPDHVVNLSLWGILQEALSAWATGLLEAFRVQANTLLIEHAHALSEDWFMQGLLDSSSLTNEPDYRVYWQKRCLNDLREHQGMVDKYLRPPTRLAEQLAGICASPWGRVAYETLRELQQPAHSTESACALGALERLGTGLKNMSLAATQSVTFSFFIDSWDALLALPRDKQAGWIHELNQLFRFINEKKLLPLHGVLALRNDQISWLLGHGGYHLYKQRLLLNVVSASEIQQLAAEYSEQYQTVLCNMDEDELSTRLLQMTEGNPQNVQEVYRRLSQLNRDESKVLDAKALDALHVQHASDLYTYLYTRLQLDILDKGPTFIQALRLVMSALSQCPDSPESTIKRISVVQQEIPCPDSLHLVEDSSLRQALEALYYYGIWVPFPTPKNELSGTTFYIPHRSKLDYLKALCGTLPPKAPLTAEQGVTSDWQQQLVHTLGQGEHIRFMFQMLPMLFEQGELTPLKLRRCVAATAPLPAEVSHRLWEETGQFLYQKLTSSEEETHRQLAAHLIIEIPLPATGVWLKDGLQDTAEAVRIAVLQSLGDWAYRVRSYPIPLTIQHDVFHALLQMFEQTISLNNVEPSWHSEEAEPYHAAVHPSEKADTGYSHQEENAIYTSLIRWASVFPEDVWNSLQQRIFCEEPQTASQYMSKNAVQELAQRTEIHVSAGLLGVLNECVKHMPSAAQLHVQNSILSLLHKIPHTHLLTHPDIASSFIALMVQLPATRPESIPCLHKAIGLKPGLSTEDWFTLLHYTCRTIRTQPGAFALIKPYFEHLLDAEALTERLNSHEYLYMLRQTCQAITHHWDAWLPEHQKQIHLRLMRMLEAAAWFKHLETLWVLLRTHQQAMQMPYLTSEEGTQLITKWEQYLTAVYQKGLPTAGFLKQLLRLG